MNNQKLMIGLLFLSLALNMIVIGYLLGFKPSQSSAMQTGAIPQDISNLYQNLPLEDKKETAQAIKKRQQEVIYNQRQIMLIRIEIAQLIQQEQLDEKRLSELFENMATLSGKNIALNQRNLFQAILILPLPERVKIAKALLRTPAKKPQPSIKATPTAQPI